MDIAEQIAALAALLDGGADAVALFDAVQHAEVALGTSPDGELEQLQALADEALARAVELGHPEAALAVASRIYFGRHDHRAGEAFSLATRAADLPRAQYLLGLFRYGGFGCDVDLPSSLMHLGHAAEAGDPDAMFELYVFHSQGIATPPDDGRAVDWCARAAEAGSARAMATMGGFYAAGHKVPRDDVEAIGWYYRAAEAGHGKAAATIGMMCALGQGADPSDDEARRWFQIAEELGFDPWPFVEECGLDPRKYAGT